MPGSEAHSHHGGVKGSDDPANDVRFGSSGCDGPGEASTCRSKFDARGGRPRRYRPSATRCYLRRCASVTHAVAAREPPRDIDTKVLMIPSSNRLGCEFDAICCVMISLGRLGFSGVRASNEREEIMADVAPLLHAKAISLGRLAIRATTAAGSGHPTTALSLAHLVTVLVYRVMRWTPADPGNPGSDRLVLSEGHAVPIIYAAWADLGVAFEPDGKRRAMTERDLMTLREIGSSLDGHPNPVLGSPFFDAATGSLGQGLSVAAGLACAARLDGVPKRIFCLIGDGESREGQIWEAMDFCADQRLGGVVAIFNCNTLGQSDYVSPAQNWEHLAAKTSAFGARTEIIDGHDPAAIERALRIMEDSRPLAIIARTVKGWGVPSLGGPGHHGTLVKPEALAGVLAELDETAHHRYRGAGLCRAEDCPARYGAGDAGRSTGSRRIQGGARHEPGIGFGYGGKPGRVAHPQERPLRCRRARLCRFVGVGDRSSRGTFSAARAECAREGLIRISTPYDALSQTQSRVCSALQENPNELDRTRDCSKPQDRGTPRPFAGKQARSEDCNSHLHGSPPERSAPMAGH
jgi:transketolase N-terminal domain/subunit